MSYHFLEEINYEDLDDLPLTEHIEWNHENEQDFNLIALDPIFWLKKQQKLLRNMHAHAQLRMPERRRQIA
jgi:hypothetical protein